MLKQFEERRHAPGRWIRAVAILAPVILVLVVWQLRNQREVPEGGQHGWKRAVATLSHGTYPNFVYRDPQYRFFPYREDPEQPAFSSSLENFWSVFSARASDDPARYARWYFLEKPAWLWSWSILQGQGDIYVYPVTTSMYVRYPPAEWTRKLMEISHDAIVLLAVLGLLLGAVHLVRPPRGAGMLHLPLLAFTALYILFAPWPRYAVPLRPELYLAALLPIAALFSVFQPRIKRRKLVRRELPHDVRPTSRERVPVEV